MSHIDIQEFASYYCPAIFTVLILCILCELAYMRVLIHMEEESHKTNFYWLGVRT